MHRTIKKRSLKQLVLVSVGALVLFLLALSASLNFANARTYIDQQLARYSMDAATFLGLALSSQKEDSSNIAKERMIDSIFDSGDYVSIQFRTKDGAIAIDRKLAFSASEVPDWFVRRMKLSNFSGEAQVMSGWTQLGTVHVQANPALAEKELWSLFKAQIMLFVGVLLVGLLILYALLRKLLAPLSQLESQAHRIASRSFDQVLELPATRELDTVVRSMNDMSIKLKRVFDEQLGDIERLRDQARKDALTGLFNREGFDARLKSDLTDRSVSGIGVLMLVMVNDFGQINIDHGRQEADAFLVSVADVLRKLAVEYRGAFLARRTGAQFSIFLPGVSVDDAEVLAQRVLSKILGLNLLRQALRDDWLNIGLAQVSDAETVASLFSKADLALRQAQERGVSGWRRFASDGGEGFAEEVRQANHWQKILQEVLASNDLTLFEQPVHRLSDHSLSHKQVLSRIEVDGQLIVAATFLPMAKRFGLMVLFDELVVDLVLKALASSEGQEHYNITLSEAAIADEVFMQWLAEQLEKHKHVLSRVSFEVPEHAIGFGEDVLVKLCDMGQNWGFSLCIDRFGVSSIPFTYLQRVSVSAIKIDSSFIRNIHLNKENQFFLRAAVQIAHSQNIQVVAIGVETEDELAMIREIGVDAATGYIIQRPSLAKF